MELTRYMDTVGQFSGLLDFVVIPHIHQRDLPLALEGDQVIVGEVNLVTGHAAPEEETREISSTGFICISV